MTSTAKLTVVMLAALVSLGSTAGCRRSAEQDADMIDVPAISDLNPSAERPKTNFPAEWQQADKALNEFILKILDICHRGDYDKFCQLMATTESPPSQEDFKRIWQAVGDITIRSVRSDENKPPKYFVHALAKLRQSDPENRTERNLVIEVFKEMDQWRIAGAPKEAARVVLMADSRPTSGPAQAYPRKQESNSAAPASGPAVYKDKHRGS